MILAISTVTSIWLPSDNDYNGALNMVLGHDPVHHVWSELLSFILCIYINILSKDSSHLGRLQVIFYKLTCCSHKEINASLWQYNNIPDGE